MADEQDLANALFGSSRLENTTLNTISTVQGVAVSDSADGFVKVKLCAESTPKEADATEENTVVELPTTPNVKEGDTVTITTQGGALKVMSVTGNTGSGDRVQQCADDASKVATNYIDIDENKGITVGNMTDETLGKNTYIDANGFQVRDGETTLAKFTENSISLGENQTASEIAEGSSANIKFCNDALIIMATQGTQGEENDCPISFSSSQQEDFLTIKNYGRTNYGDVDVAVLTDTPPTLVLNSSQIYLETDDGSFSLNGRRVVSQRTIFNSDIGTTDTVTLSESAKNFSYLEIFYNCSARHGSVKVYKPNGKDVQLQQTFFAVDTSVTQTNFETISISDTSITRGTMGYFQTAGSSVGTGTTDRQFFITRVIGIK